MKGKNIIIIPGLVEAQWLKYVARIIGTTKLCTLEQKRLQFTVCSVGPFIEGVLC